jgi:branched-chain amino acid transport system ATP-binding protein
MISLQNVWVRYGETPILKDISLEMEEKRIISLIGSNGAGKSTLVNTISGLINPFQGKIFFNGISILNIPPYKRVQMGIIQVPEGRELFPKMTVRENLLLGGLSSSRSEANKLMEEVLSLFPRMAERINQTSGSLSGGEQQMLAIGRALMARPKILMLDEPSLGLAPIIVKEIFKIICELNGRGMTILLIEQNVQMSLKISHFAYVLDNGQIAIQGTGKMLLEEEKTKKAYFGLT